MTKQEFWYEFPRNLYKWENDDEVVVIDGKYETKLIWVPLESNPKAFGVVLVVKSQGYQPMKVLIPYAFDKVESNCWRLHNYRNLADNFFDNIYKYKQDMESGEARKDDKNDTLDDYLKSSSHRWGMAQHESTFNSLYEQWTKPTGLEGI